MKKTIMMLICSVFLAAFSVSVAQAIDFTVQAEVPASDGASFTVSKVEGTSWTKLSTTNLNFGEMILDPVEKIFLPDYYWAIDVSPNGSGNPDVDVSYTDTANPNGAINDGTGLGKKGTITFAEVIDTNPQTVNVIDGMSLAETNSYPELQEEEYAGGWLRVTVGIATGDPNLEEGEAVPFVSTDAPGNYTGTLTLTATFD